MAYPNDIVHNGFIQPELECCLKNTGLVDYDLATTKVYKGVKPMWEQLGFSDNSFDIPNKNIYWKNIIPKNYNFVNLTGITVVAVESEYQEDSPTDVGIVEGSKTPRNSYNKVIIDEEEEQVWEGDYLYPILPKIDKYGIFEEDVNTDTSYGVSTAPITNKEDSGNLVFNLDLNHETTDDIIDRTSYMKLDYYKDFEVFLDEALRLKIKGKIKPDGLETSKTDQAF